MNQEQISNFIKKLRKDNNLTQKQLADKLGITFQSVSKWETGKNIPDIQTLKLISKEFNISISELLDGKKKKNDNKKFIIYCITVFVSTMIIGTLIILNTKNNDYSFKKISTTCENFNVKGSAAYNNNKLDIYISDISYCGEKDNKTYKKIRCSIYTKEHESPITSCQEKDNINLEEYLENLSVEVSEKNNICKDYNNLYMQLTAIDEDNLSRTYIIPLTMKDSCNE